MSSSIDFSTEKGSSSVDPQLLSNMASIFCCLRPRSSSRGLFRQSRSSSTITWSSQAEKVNLLNDEGTNLQRDLWLLCFRTKIQQSSPEDYPFYQKLSKTLDKPATQTPAQMLTDQYSERGLPHHASRIRKILNGIQPFSNAISAFVQADPQISALVWGSLQVLLVAALRFVSVVDDITEMLDDLSRVLPRFEAMTNILHTPRLHSALRDVYDLYISFCISTARFLENSTCYMYVQMHWSSIDRSFQHTKHQLDACKNNFDAEAGLASAQADVARHGELLEKLSKQSSSDDPITMGLVARNPLFTGREDILGKLTECLDPAMPRTSNQSVLRIRSKSRKSCVIHGIGGMGKSQVALEFTYRYRDAYSHIFWLRADTDAVLTNDFVSILKKVGVEEGNLGIDKRVELCREWLESTAEHWLLVYDNINSARSILPFWPAGIRGSMIITSQNPDVADLTTSEIELPPMSRQDGSELIRKHLRRGGSEQDSAERLSTELGGLPLAIAHFAGYVAKSQCPLQHILESFQQRAKSSQIWSCTDLASVSSYAHTLETVWDLAFRRLSQDARFLIDIVAFLDPDCIPEAMFIGEKSEIQPDQCGWQYWDVHRFNDAIRILRERHLVDREGTGGNAFLKTHRSLQRSILHHLDHDVPARQRVFQESLSIVRRAFPRQNLARRGSSDLWPMQQKYLSHVTSMNTAFVQSDPPIGNNLEFAGLLQDAAAFLYNWQGKDEARSLLGSAEKVCEQMIHEKPDESAPILAFILSDLGIHDQWGGIETRARSLERTSRALALQRSRMEKLSSGPIEDVDHIAYGRFHADHACCLIQAERFAEAVPLYQATLEAYSPVGGEDVLTVRFSMIYALQGAVATGQHDDSAAGLIKLGWELILTVLPEDSFTCLWFKSLMAMCNFTIGKRDLALQYHTEVLQTRERNLTEDHHDTLSSKYCVAVLQQHEGELETAESLLREIIQHDTFNFRWTEADLARAEYRLSVVLGLQNRRRQAVEFATRALERRKKWDKLLQKDTTSSMSEESSARSEEAEMSLFDLSVCLWHGRTAGVWANGGYW